ncbi:MAG: winged helix-turn-helix domain-containing protein, partial [Candidatus Entotheonellia bacterium]
MPREPDLRFGPFRLELAREGLWRGAEALRLRPKTFAALRYLLEHPGRLLSKEELLQAVWPEVAVGEAVLSVTLAELRKALGDDPRAPQFIETVHRRGYR